MPEYVHGGDVYSYAEAYGGVPLDLSANINPFGIPETVKQAMRDAVEDCTRYPDPFCRAARRAIGAAEGVDPDWLLRERRGGCARPARGRVAAGDRAADRAHFRGV